MDCYSEKLERQMSRLYDSLSERDRRRLKRQNWGMVESSTSHECWGVIARQSSMEYRKWNPTRNFRHSANEKRGRTQTAERNVSAVGRELSGGAPRPHRRRSDAGRRQMDEPLSPADLATTENVGNSRRKKRRIEPAMGTRISSSQAAEESHHGTACRPQCPVRKDRPTQTAIPRSGTSRHQH